MNFLLHPPKPLSLAVQLILLLFFFYSMPRRNSLQLNPLWLLPVLFFCLKLHSQKIRVSAHFTIARSAFVIFIMNQDCGLALLHSFIHSFIPQFMYVFDKTLRCEFLRLRIIHLRILFHYLLQHFIETEPQSWDLIHKKDN